MSLHITVCTTAVDNSSSEQQKGSAPPQVVALMHTGLIQENLTESSY